MSERGHPAARLPVLDLALSSVDAVQRAVARVGGTPFGEVDAERVAAAFMSDRIFRLDGQQVDGFAPLSGFFRTSDGWVRTHANYPHHRERLMRMLALPDDADRATLTARLSTVRAQDIEDEAVDVGAIAVRVRTAEEWRASGPGRAVAGTASVTAAPVISARRADALHTSHALDAGPLPLSGVRVLDLTRVIAGPVATRTLALLGADVLRIDSPRLPEIAWQQLDTGQGKRTALLDLATTAGLATAQNLLETADVLVTGYRPGAVEAFGLRPSPGIVHARVTAWGDDGPWASRRGFDSIVQAATGIAMIESRDGETPGTLPSQALDHATGYFLAAAVIDAIADRAADGRGREIDAALVRTAHLLLDVPGRRTGIVPDVALPSASTVVTHIVDVDGRERAVTTARPAFAHIADFPAPAHPWGTDDPRWADD